MGLCGPNLCIWLATNNLQQLSEISGLMKYMKYQTLKGTFKWWLLYKNRCGQILFQQDLYPTYFETVGFLNDPFRMQYLIIMKYF